MSLLIIVTPKNVLRLPRKQGGFSFFKLRSEDVNQFVWILQVTRCELGISRVDSIEEVPIETLQQLNPPQVVVHEQSADGTFKVRVVFWLALTMCNS